MDVADVRHASSATSDTECRLQQPTLKPLLVRNARCIMDLFIFLSGATHVEEHALQIFMSWGMP